MNNVTFKVKMDKDSEAVEVKLDVNFEGVSEEMIRKHAMANMVVAWQGQIRSHWTEFTEGKMSEKVVFGTPLFTSTRGVTVVKEVTVERAAEFLGSGTPLEVLTKKIDLLEKVGIDVPQALWDEMDKLTDGDEN